MFHFFATFLIVAFLVSPFSALANAPATPIPSEVLSQHTGIWQDVAGTGSITSATYNGVALTKATSTRASGMASEIWYLINPDTGSSTVSVTITDVTGFSVRYLFHGFSVDSVSGTFFII